MGATTSIPTELIGREYRILTKDQLTFTVYNICKNIFAKWCFPLRKPEEVTQKEINNFLDVLNFNSKTIPMNFVVSYNDTKSYNIPYDFYLRALYRFSESVEDKIGNNMEKVFFEKVLKKTYGDTSTCINKLTMTKIGNTFEYDFKNIITNYNDAKKKDVIDSILSIYSKCRNGAIFLSSYKKGELIGHRTIIFFENINNVLNVYYYDPHGSSGMSWSSEQNIYNGLVYFFEEMKPYMAKYNLTDIVVKQHQTMCLIGIQTYTTGYDIGMCQIFSSLWLYIIVKIMAKAKKNNIQLPETEKWIYLVDDYFISQFDRKQMYNALLLFMSKLFNFYTTENKDYSNELNNFNMFMFNRYRQSIDKFEVPYVLSTSSDDIKEMENYIVKLAQEGIEETRLDEIIDDRVKKITDSCVSDSRINYNIKLIISAELNKKDFKINEAIRRLAIKEFNEATKTEDVNITEKRAKRIAIEVVRMLKIKDDYKKIAIEGIVNAKVYIPNVIKYILPSARIIKGKRRLEDYSKEDTYEEYEERVKKQKKEEEKYFQTIRGKIPLFRKKGMFEECEKSSDCLTGCCFYDEALRMSLCNESDACPK